MSLFAFLRRGESLEDVFSRDHILLDVRTRGEFASGSVPGAINIPLNEIPNRVKEIQKKGKPVIAFCRSGMRSGQAKAFLSDAGIECYNGGSWNDVARKMMERE